MTCSFTYWQEKLYKASAIWNKQNFSSFCLPPSSLTIKDAYVSSANRSCRVGSALLKHASLIIDSAKDHQNRPHDPQRKKPGEKIHFLFRSQDGAEKRVCKKTCHQGFSKSVFVCINSVWQIKVNSKNCSDSITVRCIGRPPCFCTTMLRARM